MPDVSAFADVVPLDRGLCVLSTLRRDGSIQTSVVNAGVLPHPVTGVQVVALVAAGGTHGDWDTYDCVMAEERRAAVPIVPRRAYTNPKTR